MKIKVVIFLTCILALFVIVGCHLEEVVLSSDSSEEQRTVSESVSSQSSAASVTSSSSRISSVASSESSYDSAVNSQIVSSKEPNSSSIAAPEPASNPDPLGLAGEGEIALFVTDSNSGKVLELNKSKTVEFLAKIDFSKFTPADMTQEITPPDAIVGQAGTEGNYISIGMPNTSILFIYDTQTQALLITASGAHYFNMPSGMYETVKSIING